MTNLLNLAYGDVMTASAFRRVQKRLLGARAGRRLRRTASPAVADPPARQIAASGATLPYGDLVRRS